MSTAKPPAGQPAPADQPAPELASGTDVTAKPDEDAWTKDASARTGEGAGTNAAPVEQPAPPRGVLRALLGLPVHLYHARLGFLLGHRILMLVHTGRKTGIRRETVLEVVHYDAATREAVVAAGWGRRTGWLHNVEAGLVHEVWIGGDRFVPAYRILGPDVAERVFAEYERRNRLIAPIVREVISRLVGWPYDGTPAARRRVVEQLPLVAFRPDTSASPGG